MQVAAKHQIYIILNLFIVRNIVLSRCACSGVVESLVGTCELTVMVLVLQITITRILG